MKRFAAFCLAGLLAAFSFNSAPLAHAGQQTSKPAADIQSSASAVDAEPQDPQAQGQLPTGQEIPFRRDVAPEIKAYDRVITKDAKSDPGVFTVHRIKDKVYYEIPKSELGKDFLWVSQIARTTLGVGYGGQAAGNHVVRWERHANRVLLRGVSYEVVADPKLPVSRAVQAANNNPIIMSFWIEAFGKDEAPVIDVTRLFTTEVTEFSARARLRARAFDATRSFIERIVSFPTNIEVEATHTFTSPPDTTTPAGPPQPPNPFLGAGMRTGSGSVVMHYSMVKLPETPMMPRLYDERVGYFTVRQTDYGQDEHRAPERRYITRWRLEKKDPDAAVSEPVKPIVYYVDPATPTKWVPYIKRGIEKWQAAFEEAGFKNAIIAREAPSQEQDPDWSPEDARYSVIRWLPSTTENASGPHVSDPRTGEIIESDIQFYHNVMNLQRDWYFLQVGALDPRAQHFPLPDDLMGTLIEYVVAHEVGHTLGFQHNMKASALYPADKIRDKEWLKTMGHTPTLMDYSRFNYVVQPEDKVDPALLVPGIGPYDKWATMWGYKPIPGAHTPDQERKTLDEWARAQDKTPWLRFSTAGTRGSDPGENTEAVGDADAVKSTAMGIKNLERVSNMLLTATTRPGEPYDDLEELYGRMLGQWATELNHVTQIVGGVNSQEKYAGQDGVLFTPVPKQQQAAAVRFLNENAFATPSWAIKPEVLRRIEPSGALDLIKASQLRVLNSLMSGARFNRLVEQEAMDGAAAYKPAEFLEEVRNGIWRELEAPSVRIDAYRRNLQRAYLELLSEKLNGRAPVTDEQRPFLRGELRSLNQMIARAMLHATDRATRLHLEDSKDQIAKALDPKFAPPAPTAAAQFQQGGRRGWDEYLELFDPSDPNAPLFCWPDYAVKRPRD
ncbi:MAG TPA: zinc-dependent metalloprotease [Blastocatellia bacterium]|nr:zinc-dependent metalloprotease [Blastocatellia bacterium]